MFCQHSGHTKATASSIEKKFLSSVPQPSFSLTKAARTSGTGWVCFLRAEAGCKASGCAGGYGLHLGQVAPSAQLNNSLCISSG